MLDVSNWEGAVVQIYDTSEFSDTSGDPRTGLPDLHFCLFPNSYFHFTSPGSPGDQNRPSNPFPIQRILFVHQSVFKRSRASNIWPRVIIYVLAKMQPTSSKYLSAGTIARRMGQAYAQRNLARYWHKLNLLLFTFRLEYSFDRNFRQRNDKINPKRKKNIKRCTTHARPLIDSHKWETLSQGQVFPKNRFSATLAKYRSTGYCTWAKMNIFRHTGIRTHGTPHWESSRNKSEQHPTSSSAILHTFVFVI